LRGVVSSSTVSVSRGRALQIFFWFGRALFSWSYLLKDFFFLIENDCVIRADKGTSALEIYFQFYSIFNFKNFVFKFIFFEGMFGLIY